ncbi:MAG: hypothetical protein COA99_14500, partial [Moraxellaceae bacterium]
IRATVAEVKRKRFPLSRPLNLITKHPPAGLAQQFIVFAQSEAVSDLVADQYFVSLVVNEESAHFF